MRQKQRELHGVTPTPPKAPEPPKKKPEVKVEVKPKAPPKPKAEQVQYKCGHEAALRSITDGCCPACRNENRIRKAAQRREKQRYYSANKEGAQRLPHGSAFQSSYDAEKQQWTGTLTIDGRVFSATVSGVFNLMRDLDAQYRQFLRDKTAAPPSPAQD
jgi:hypothetical protein